MWATKPIALRRREMSPRYGSRLILLAAALLIAAVPRVQAQRLPLPPDEQEAVDNAIERGVKFLKKTQRKSGTWAKPGEKHPIGYAVLPALTLLECGVPADDPLIRKTSHYLRIWAPRLDRTYELSLAILFLDRLGDPKDKKLIQTFALRLIAGQSATGGWGYKCPILGSTAELELLTALRHLAPPPAMPLLAGDRPDMPALAGKPGGRPDLAGGVGRRPGDLTPIGQAPGGLPLEGLAALAGLPSLSGGTASSPSSVPSLSGTSSLSGGTVGDGLDKALAPSVSSLAPADRWRDCLGVSTFERSDSLPFDDKDAAKEAKKGQQPAAAKKPYVLPERLRLLTVVQDPNLHLLQDPKDKRDDLIVTTTDNSNTQFAILALWTAQRYDVPMNRTLNLVIRRYLTSQNPDGSWGYDYQFGGGCWTRPHTMTCVGLIGLAVAHGLAQAGPAGQGVRDPRIIGGLIALYKNIGHPVERLVQLPMQNLYFLWSVERVAVLYNLPTIGDKDWYRWGAQVLVGNQQPKGNWANGGYPAAHLLPDTCFALLFLKRVNLVKDLTAKLPFKAADLNDGIMERPAPTPSPTPKRPEPPTPAKKSLVPVEPPQAAQPQNDGFITKPLSSLDGTAQASNSAAESASEGGSKKKWIVLCVVVFVVLAGGSVCFIIVLAQRRREEKEERQGKEKGRKKNRKLQSTT